MLHVRGFRRLRAIDKSHYFLYPGHKAKANSFGEIMPPRQRVKTDTSIESMRFEPKKHPTEAERIRRYTWQANDALTALNADDSLTSMTRGIAKRVIDHFRGLNLNVKEKEKAALEAVRAQLVQEHKGQLPYPVRHGLEIGYELLMQAKSPRRNTTGK